MLNADRIVQPRNIFDDRKQSLMTTHIHSVRIFDGDVVSSGSSVTIDEGRVVAIGSAPPEGAISVDGRGARSFLASSPVTYTHRSMLYALR